MPNINMQHFEELQRNQHSIDVEIDASQVVSPQQNFPMMLETPNSTNSVLNVVAINELGEQLPTEIEGIANNKNWIHFKDLIHTGWDRKMKVFYGGSIGKPATDSIYGSEAVWLNHVGVHLMNNDPDGDVADSVLDSSSNGQHRTPYGSMTTSDLVDIDYGKGIDFDGSDDRLMIADLNSAYDFGTGDWSVSFKVKPDVITGTYVGLIYLGFSPDTITSRLNIAIHNSRLYRYSGSWVDTGKAISVSQWSLVTFERTSGIEKLYINGAYSGWSRSFTNDIGGDLTRSDIGLGSTLFNGIFGCIRIKNIGTSANYESTTYNNLNNPTASRAEPFYKLISKEHNFVESLQSIGRAG